VIWYAYEDSKVYGGWPVSNASSSTECRQRCDENSTCSGYDFDAAKQPGYQCYIHTANSHDSIHVGTAPGVKHFSRRVSCGLLFENYFFCIIIIIITGLCSESANLRQGVLPQPKVIWVRI